MGETCWQQSSSNMSYDLRDVRRMLVRVRLPANESIRGGPTRDPSLRPISNLFLKVENGRHLCCHLLPVFLALVGGWVTHAVRVGSHAADEKILSNARHRCEASFLRRKENGGGEEHVQASEQAVSVGLHAIIRGRSTRALSRSEP